MTISGLEERDYVSVSKGIHKQKLRNLQKSLQLAKVVYYFQRKHQNVNIGFSTFCALRPKWCVLAGSKVTYSVFICSTHQNVMLLIDAIDWNLTYKDLIKLN